jgi:xylulokinase
MDPSLLPAIGQSAQIAGQLVGGVAATTGLEPGTPVVLGGGDQACQALGNGIVDPGVVSCTIGTGGQLFAPALAPTYDPDLRLHCFCHVLPDRWHLMAAILAAGLSLRWLRDQVLPGSSYGELADQATAIPAGSEGLFFLPHLAGERTPHMDPRAQASFIGLTLRHGRGHLARAVMEGVVFALRQGLELMAALGVPVERIVASGGASDHPLWLQLQADIFNGPIYRTGTREAAAVGAALLAGIGVGMYADAQEACRRAVRWHEKVVVPDAANVERYEAGYAIYCQLYPALENPIGRLHTTKARRHQARPE